MSLARAVTADADLIADACAAAWRMARFVLLGRERAGDDSQAAAFARRWSGREPRQAPPASVAAALEPDAETLAAAGRFLTAARAWSVA